MARDARRSVRGHTGPDSEELLRLVVAEIEELKGDRVEVLDVKELTDMTDYMVVVTGRTDRHVRAITEKIVMSAKHRDAPPLGVEGERVGEWVLVDLCDVIVHVMQPETRDLYQLEKLWSPVVELREQTGAPAP